MSVFVSNIVSLLTRRDKGDFGEDNDDENDDKKDGGNGKEGGSGKDDDDAGDCGPWMVLGDGDGHGLQNIEGSLGDWNIGEFGIVDAILQDISFSL